MIVSQRFLAPILATLDSLKSDLFISQTKLFLVLLFVVQSIGHVRLFETPQTAAH